jgi:NAD(P)H-flavin reductase/ferredoxin
MSARCFEVQLEPGGRRFTVEPGEPVLNAALRHGIPLKYGCRHGNCSTCKYMVLNGEVDFGSASPYSLSEGERDEGWALLCCAQPRSDLVIELPAEQRDRLRPTLPPRERVARIRSVEPVSRSLWRLRLSLDDPLDFYAGQFIEVAIPNQPGEWRSYSMANSPLQPLEVELIILRIPSGVFSGGIDRLEPGSALTTRGPYGTSYLRDGDRPVLLVAGGSGIAPMMSILRHAAAVGDQRSFTFFYGARTRADLPLLDEVEEIQSRFPAFTFHPALSEPTPECDWKGSVGLIAQVIQHSVGDASPYDAYLCGPPPMCDTVALILAAKGLPEERSYLDRFYFAIVPAQPERVSLPGN